MSRNLKTSESNASEARGNDNFTVKASEESSAENEHIKMEIEASITQRPVQTSKTP